MLGLLEGISACLFDLDGVHYPRAARGATGVVADLDELLEDA